MYEKKKMKKVLSLLLIIMVAVLPACASQKENLLAESNVEIMPSTTIVDDTKSSDIIETKVETNVLSNEDQSEEKNIVESNNGEEALRK
ncbi:MAG: hypothetical protein IJ593_09085 [Lachnospiraceae bacterium]|nr:hypothetical protein [Lachnospiraceae bacterium]